MKDKLKFRLSLFPSQFFIYNGSASLYSPVPVFKIPETELIPSSMLFWKVILGEKRHQQSYEPPEPQY